MKNSIYLTSKLDLYKRDLSNRKIAKKFNNYNEIIDNFKKDIKRYGNFLYIASTEDNYSINDEYANVTFKSFEMTLPFKNYNILDGRTISIATDLVKKADFIFISGGNVALQNNFFQKINLRKLIKNTSAVICSVSAGSMNCAKDVYCPPETEEEYKNKKFIKSFKGLGLTDINILPHYNVLKDVILCEKKYIKEIIFPDSTNKKICAIPDGAYILIKNDIVSYYGEIVTINNNA